MATVKQRGDSWQLNWSDATGQHRKSLGAITATQAETIRREKELELRTGRRYRTTGITFAAFAVDYLAWYKVQYPSTYERTEIIVNIHLMADFGTRDLDSIIPPHATGYIAKRAAYGAAQSTITRELRCLVAMLNRSKEWRYITEHGLEQYTPPVERTNKAPYYYPELQLKILYWASYGHEQTWRLYANTGMRRNEALKLKLTDIRRGSVYIESDNDAPTKSKKWREVPLNDAALCAIEALKKLDAKPYLLPRMHPNALTQAFAACANRVALPGSLHTLRHTFISHLVMAGVDLPTVKELAGHASIATTMRYAHLAEHHKQSAVSKIAL